MVNAETKRNMLIYSGSDIVLERIDYNWSAFYDLGGRYILSSVRLHPNDTSRLLFVKKFSDPKSAWDVYLYKVLSQLKVR